MTDIPWGTILIIAWVAAIVLVISMAKVSSKSDKDAGI